jgi:hypothetical protein
MSLRILQILKSAKIRSSTRRVNSEELSVEVRIGGQNIKHILLYSPCDFNESLERKRGGNEVWIF